jgi:hypothetical protein
MKYFFLFEPKVFSLRSLLFVLLMGFVFHSETSQAAFGNYNSILIGDQASGMGGAYTSMIGDASALAWYNPAGLIWLKGKSFSSAVGIYKKFDTVYGDLEDFTKASLRVNQGFFRSLPSTSGSVISYEDWKAAISIVVPDYENFQGDINNDNTNTSTLSYVDESLWVGGALSKKISKTESLGVTAYYTARNLTKAVNDRTINGSNFKIFNEQKTITENSIIFQVGYMKFLPYNWKMGINLRFPSIPIAGQGTYFDSTVETGQTPTSHNYTGIASRDHIPAKASLGFSWEKPQMITFSGDLSIYGHEKFSDMEDYPDIAEIVEHRSIINAQGGIEIHAKPWLKVRLGGFTNFSSHETPDASLGKGQQDKVDQLGFSANMALTQGAMTYTFGGYYTGGRGKSVQRVNHQYQIVNRTSQVFTMLVATSYFF